MQRQGRHWGAYELPQGEGSGVGIGRRHKPLCRVRNWPLTACPTVRVRHARLRAQGSFVGAISMAPTWVFFSVETAPVTFSQCEIGVVQGWLIPRERFLKERSSFQEAPTSRVGPTHRTRPASARVIVKVRLPELDLTPGSSLKRPRGPALATWLTRQRCRAAQGAERHSAATPRSHGANRTKCPLVELLHPVLRVVLTARL